MLYNIEREQDYDIYTFDDMDLRIKCVEKNNDTVNVYIKLNGCNPLLSMLFGSFAEYCDLDCSIEFEVEHEIPKKDNSLYIIVSKDFLNDFIEEIYMFVFENKVSNKISDKDICLWDF